jgi:pRiA4b ORF-3-like protein
MATKKIWLPQDIYEIQVTLPYTRPPIWGRLLVPAGLTLEALHDLLQVAMGWDDSHRQEFRIGQRRFGKPDPNHRRMGLHPIGNEPPTPLYRVLGKVGAKAMYTYDFGDRWEHGIVVEKVLPPEPGAAYPLCGGGKLQGPPEDCGGIPGYYNLLEAIRDPPTRNIRTCWIGWAATTTPRPSPSRMSTGDSPLSNAGGQRA